MAQFGRHAGRILAGGFAALSGVGFIVSGILCGYVASVDIRASSAADALATAYSSAATAERRTSALMGADLALAWGAPSGDLLELAASRSLLTDPPSLDSAEALSWEALRRSPTRGGAWARLAYIDAARDGVLDTAGQNALARSFEVQPFAREALRHWRLEFALTHWQELDVGTREAALGEARRVTAGGARWYEESLFLLDLARRLEPEAGAALVRAVTHDAQDG
jgi:hypothetical protein